VYGYAEVVERHLILLEMNVALAAEEASLGLVRWIVLDHLGEVNDRVVPVAVLLIYLVFRGLSKLNFFNLISRQLCEANLRNLMDFDTF
jgi:hypothetical protein